MVVWSDNLDTIIPTCREFEDKLIKLVWRSRPALTSSASALTAGSLGTVVTNAPSTTGFNITAPSGTVLLPSTTPSSIGLDEKSGASGDLIVPELKSKEAEKAVDKSAKAKKKNNKGKSLFGWRVKAHDPSTDLEDGENNGKPEARPIRLFAPIYGGLGAGLSIFFIGSGVSE